MYKILVTGKIHDSALERLRAEPDLAVDDRPDLPLAEILKIVGEYHCIIARSETPLKRELLDRAGNLAVIAIAAVGVANVDVDYATSKGILVINTPGKNTNSAAELTLALMLAAARKLTQAHQTMQNGGWDRHRFSGTELLGRTVGIVGLGNVGHRVARFCRGFEMRVLACDPYLPAETFERHQVERVDLPTLLRESDFLTVHTPKNKETTGMIGAKELALMRPGSVVVNAARGGIVVEQDLAAALRSGHIAAAGIDTWLEEPPRDNPFRDLPQVVMTPHIGATTEAAQIRIAESIADQVPRALRGEIIESPVNMPQIRMLQGNLMTAYAVLVEKLGCFAAQYADFKPDLLRIFYRGDIATQDCRLLRLAFLKGLLNGSIGYVSYVNAEQRAAAEGLKVEDVDDPGFTDYESAVKFVLSRGKKEFSIGGVVFSGPHPRITLVDGFTYETEPEGTFLLVRCNDKLGVLAAISGVLDRHGVLISRIDFSHSEERRRTMFMFRVAHEVPDETVEELRALPHARMVRKIAL